MPNCATGRTPPGAYHSRTPEYAQIYRARFDRILSGLGDAPLVVAGLEPETPAAAAPRAKAAPAWRAVR